MISHSNSDWAHIRAYKHSKYYGFQDHKSNVRAESLPSSKISDIFTEFCKRSTIHGVRHFVDQNLHWMERALWMIVIVASMVMCFAAISDVWTNWQSEPIIVSAESKSFPVNTIPFPAVSICPFAITSTNKFNYSAAYRSLRKIDGNNSRDLTANELKLMKLVGQYCFQGTSPFEPKNVSDDEYFNENDNIWGTINEIAPAFNETFIFCKLFNDWVDCGKLFVSQITDRGLCYTFNALNARELFTNEVAPGFQRITLNQSESNWNLDFRLPESKYENYPYSAHDSSYRSSLTVVFKVLKADLDYLCSGGAQGFTVSLHLPNEGPLTHKRYFYVPLEQTVLLTVGPQYGEPSDAVRKHPPHIRGCYLKSERQLRFYKQYTMSNCRLECLTNLTLAYCGCVRYSMPRSNGTKVCGPGKYDCYKKMDNGMSRCKKMRSCKCLPTCPSLQFDARSSQTNYDFGSSYIRTMHEPKYDTENAMFSRLIVKFKSDLVIGKKLINSLDIVEFFTKVGGICSIFVGASLISFIELVYYFTLRLFFAYRSNQ